MLNSQGEVTPIDSIVTPATAVCQRSMVKAIQKCAVNGQSVLRSNVKRKIWAGLHVRSNVQG